jgi:excisionase family DNA binding protein
MSGRLEAVLDELAALIVEKLNDRAALPLRPRLLTIDQAANYIGRTRDAVQHLIASGKLPCVKADRRNFLDVRDLDAWIESSKAAGVIRESE